MAKVLSTHPDHVELLIGPVRPDQKHDFKVWSAKVTSELARALAGGCSWQSRAGTSTWTAESNDATSTTVEAALASVSGRAHEAGFRWAGGGPG